MDARVEAVIAQVAASSGNARLTLRSLARQLKVPDRRLADLFKQSTGRTFRVHIREIRLRNVVHLLCSRSELSIKQITDLAGYQSTSSLDRDFRRAYGVSPSVVRKAKSVPPGSSKCGQETGI